MAPELVRNPNVQFMQYGGGASSRSSSSSSSTRQGYDAKKVDAWAMGVLFYVLIAAQYPFSVSCHSTLLQLPSTTADNPLSATPRLLQLLEVLYNRSQTRFFISKLNGAVSKQFQSPCSLFGHAGQQQPKWWHLYGHTAGSASRAL